MKIEVYSPTIRRREMDAVLTAMVEEKIGPGERSRLLIQTAKEQLNYDYALALRSPAVALFLALKAIVRSEARSEAAADAKPDLQTQDSASQSPKKYGVIISALSPRYYLQVLKDLQLIPLYCDVSYDFPCISKSLIETVITAKPSDIEVVAIVLHHTLGFVPETAAIAELGFPIIEDISQSYGSFLAPLEKEKPADKEKNESKAPANSFFSDSQLIILGLEEKDLLTSGGGALLFAMNRKESSLLRSFSDIPDEYCMPDINSALAIVQFKEIRRNLERRREIAEVYLQATMSLSSRTKHKRFISNNDNYCNYSFSIVLDSGLKDVIAYARKKEIILENALANCIASSGFIDNCPVSNSLVLRTILFPLYPRLRSVDIERVSRLIMTLP